MLPVVQGVPSQFPALYLKEGPNFIAFVKAYYEWMQLEGNPLWFTNKLRDFQDLDKTLDQFLYHFQNELMNLIPGDIAADPRLVMKHIIDLYRAKGSSRGIELLFRIVFNEDIKIYLPGRDIFAASDNKWVQDSYIEVSSNPFLNNLVGQTIFSSSQLATALVESYNQVTVNNILVNVLTISHIEGKFNNGDLILCNDVPGLTPSNCPRVVGSLSSVSLLEGGENWNVGDILQVRGVQGGSGGLARVVSTEAQSGEVGFSIGFGGKGYSLNAIVTVTGGNGTGATFNVGSITNKSIITLNSDQIQTYLNTPLENNTGPVFLLNYSGTVGTFSTNEVVNSTINAISIDFSYVSGQSLTLFETLTNTALGISVQLAKIDNPNFLYITGTGITNPNLVANVILKGGTSSNTVFINSIYPKEVITGNGVANVINSTFATVTNASGYFLPTATLRGQTSAATANLQATQRLTNWVFPFNSGNTNLDTSLNAALTIQNITVGTISSLTNIDPGRGYATPPLATVIEPLVLASSIPDGLGGFWGGDANIVTQATSANGIATAVSVVESGYGFIPGEEVLLSSSNSNIVITGAAIVDTQGITQGYWQGKESFVSDTNFIYDSNYYQQFAYEIWAPIMLNKYQQLVENVIGPAGYNLFGRYYVQDSQDVSSSIALGTMVQS